jgi:hypothetical protein
MNPSIEVLPIRTGEILAQPAGEIVCNLRGQADPLVTTREGWPFISTSGQTGHRQHRTVQCRFGSAGTAQARSAGQQALIGRHPASATTTHKKSSPLNQSQELQHMSVSKLMSLPVFQSEQSSQWRFFPGNGQTLRTTWTVAGESL